jgi:tRNA(Arg) A34 adenosine deaminase TadA
MSTGGGASGFPAAWQRLRPAFRGSLEQAYGSLAAGGLAVGAALTDPAGAVVALGRNRAYDPPGGPDALQGTPLAHAEMNVLAAARTGWGLAEYTLWSTQQPCSMCAEAISFTGVGSVRFLAPDPWALAAGVADRHADPPCDPADDRWLVSANLFFLLAIASAAGLDHATVARNRELEPETAEIVVALVADGASARTLTDGRSVTEVLPDLWDRIETAAEARGARVAAC